MSERDTLNELAQQLANDAGQRITKIPGIRAVCVTFVGTAEIPLGAYIYNDEFQDASTVLTAIDRLAQHVSFLTQALGRYERDHSEGLGGQTKHEVEPDCNESSHNTTSSAKGDETAQRTDELPADPDR